MPKARWKSRFLYSNHIIIYVSHKCGDWRRFCLSKSDRAVSVLGVRDPESRLADQAKGALIYAFAIHTEVKIINLVSLRYYIDPHQTYEAS